MRIESHFDESGTIDSIVVTEALPVEQIATELFEIPSPFLSFRDVEVHPDGTASGSFRITAANGEWTYRLVREIWWLNGVLEAELALGEVLLWQPTTSGSAPR